MTRGPCRWGPPRAGSGSPVADAAALPRPGAVRGGPPRTWPVPSTPGRAACPGCRRRARHSAGRTPRPRDAFLAEGLPRLLVARGRCGRLVQGAEDLAKLPGRGGQKGILVVRAEQGLAASRQGEVVAAGLADVQAARRRVIDPACGVEQGRFVRLRRGHDNPRRLLS